MTDRRRPRTDVLYVVRWISIRNARGDIYMRYYTRRRDAHAFADHLRSNGQSPRVYRTASRWREDQP